MKAIEIDWSKAPEGATHFMPENSENWASWYKKHDGKWMCWLFDGDLQWNEVGYDEDYILNNSIAKHEEWNGTGLPPAGCEIEYHSSSGGWRPGEYIGQFNGQMVIGCRGTGVIGYCPTETVRPIRTPEQIAAEERERACDVIYGILRKAERPGNLSDMAEAIYDAGYRKVEGDKQ